MYGTKNAAQCFDFASSAMTSMIFLYRLVFAMSKSVDRVWIVWVQTR